MLFVASICKNTFQQEIHAMTKRSVLILVGPDYKEMEVWYPKYRLEAAGYSAPLAGIGEKSYRGKYGYPSPVYGQVRYFKLSLIHI